MINEILLKGKLFTKDYDSREKINNILEKEGITDFTFYYIDDKFEINEFVNIGKDFDNDLYLKNLVEKLKPNVKEGNNFLGIYHLENKIEF